MSSERYDPEAFYFFEGATVLHTFANSFPSLEFTLNKYHQTNPKLLNMIFVKDKNGDNVLEKAIKC